MRLVIAGHLWQSVHSWKRFHSLSLKKIHELPILGHLELNNSATRRELRQYVFIKLLEVVVHIRLIVLGREKEK